MPSRTQLEHGADDTDGSGVISRENASVELPPNVVPEDRDGDAPDELPATPDRGATERLHP